MILLQRNAAGREAKSIVLVLARQDGAPASHLTPMLLHAFEAHRLKRLPSGYRTEHPSAQIVISATSQPDVALPVRSRALCASCDPHKRGKSVGTTTRAGGAWSRRRESCGRLGTSRGGVEQRTAQTCALSTYGELLGRNLAEIDRRGARRRDHGEDRRQGPHGASRGRETVKNFPTLTQVVSI
jgi:hypothetical protein